MQQVPDSVAVSALTGKGARMIEYFYRSFKCGAIYQVGVFRQIVVNRTRFIISYNLPIIINRNFKHTFGVLSCITGLCAHA